MYDNIGKKIKLLAKAVTIVFSVASIIVAIASIVSNVPWGAVFFFMPILFWISSFVLYGFGELIDKVCDIEARVRNVECKREIQGKEDRGQKVERSATDINYYQLKEKNIRLAKIEKLRDQGLISEEEYCEIISKEE